MLLTLLFVLVFQSAIRSSGAELLNGYLHRRSLSVGEIRLLYSGAQEGWEVTMLIGAVLAMLCAAQRWEALLLPSAVLIAGAFLNFWSAAWFLPLAFLWLAVYVTENGWSWHRAIPGILAVFILGSMLQFASPGMNRIGMQASAETADLIHGLLYEPKKTTMPEGRLRNLSAFVPNDAPMLEITMDKPHKVYLRGFVGEYYTPSGWESLPPAELEEADSLFYWLHKDGFYAQTQLGTVLDTEETDFTLTPVGACSAFGYLPYGLTGIEQMDPDAFPDQSGKPGAYSAKVHFGTLSDWYTAQARLLTEGMDPAYAAYESAYREFVYAHDLALPDQTAELLGQMLQNEQQTMTLAEIQAFVHSFLDEQLHYEKTIVTKNGSIDFLSYTLLTQGRGYSVHYATTAVCLLRYLGVPARYAEGYYLSADAAQTDVILTGEHAHAWPEIYLDGVGWIPFEVTPGYMDQEELELQNLMEDPNSPIHQALNQSYTQQTFVIPRSEVRQPTDKEERNEPIHLLSGLLPVLLILLLFFPILWRIWEYRKLCKALRLLEKAPAKEAIPGLYAYAVTLLDVCGYEAGSAKIPLEDAAADQKEALFSNHPMTQEQKDRALCLARSAEDYCLTHCSFAYRFYLRWIRCIYR